MNNSSASQALNALTGWRFIAAFAVLYHHCVVFGLPAARFRLGALAVTFFFVLSGFILTYVYRQRMQTATDVRQYFFTRWARIWPLHLVCLLIAVSYYPLTPDYWSRFFGNLFLVHSWSNDRTYFFSFNSPSWSISTEALFYALFPLLLWGGGRWLFGKWLLIGGLTTGTLAYLQYAQSHDSLPAGFVVSSFVQHFPLMRVWEFVTGMCAGEWFARQRERQPPESRAVTWGERWRGTGGELVVISLAFAWGYYIINPRNLYLLRQHTWGGETWSTWLSVSGYFLIFAVAIYVFAGSRGWLAQFLGSRPIVYLGEISFSLYMIHNAVIRGFQNLGWDQLPSSPGIMFVAVTVFSLLASAALYHLVEIPSKEFLLALYQRRSWNPIPMWRRGLVNWYQSSWFGPSWFAALLILYFLSVHWRDIQRQQQQNRIMAMFVDTSPIHFEKVATLHRCNWVAVPEGWKLEMVWEKHRPTKFKRLFHLCDAQGERLRSPAQNQQQFQGPEPGTVWWEELTLSNEVLAGVDRVGIVLYDEDQGCLLISGAQDNELDLNRHRYILSVPNTQSGQTAGTAGLRPPLR